MSFDFELHRAGSQRLENGFDGFERTLTDLLRARVPLS
jgi:hypothetical protein